MYLVSEEIGNICKELGINFKFASLIESAKALTGELRVPYYADKAYPAMIINTVIDSDSDTDPRHKFKFKMIGWLIVTTDPNYTTEQRLATTYKNEIYPLFDSFKTKLKKSVNVVSYYGLKKVKITELYFLKENGTHFNERVDAIRFDIDDLYRKHDKRLFGKIVL